VTKAAAEDVLVQIGQRIASGAEGYGAARALLAAAAPRLDSGVFSARENESAGDFAVRIVSALDQTILPIQGPPGSGKTFCGARMICDLVRRGKKVGVTATSHNVIGNFLGAVATAAAGAGVAVRLAHKDRDGATEDATSQVRLLGDNA
jgi:uncharacterized protein